MGRKVKRFEMVSAETRIVGTASELAGLLHYCRANIYMAVRRGCRIGKRWTVREIIPGGRDGERDGEL